MGSPETSAPNLPSVCVVGELPPPAGGMALQAQRLSAGLRGQGHRVLNVDTNALPPRSAWRRIRGLRGLANLALFLWRLRAARECDCVHVFSQSFLSFFVFTVPAVAAGRLWGRRVLVHYHGGGAKAFLRRWHRLALPVIRMADVLLVPSAFLGEVFQRYGLSSKVVPNVLDLDAFPYRERRPLRPRLVMARHLEPDYNVACGIRAFARVAERLSGARLVIAGDGGERAALERLSRELGLAGKVVFAGNVDNPGMRAVYDDADVFLNSSRVDNQPISVLEAFASGLPVVSTRVGGIPYMLVEGSEGLLADDDDSEGLARQVLRLIEDPDLAATLTANGRRRLLPHGWDEVYPQLRALYEASRE